MATPNLKRRILVAFEDDVSENPRSSKRQERISIGRTIVEVFVDQKATNGELAQEIAVAFEQPNVTLNISDGPALGEKDTVETIGEHDIVTARAKSSATSPPEIKIEVGSAHPDPVARFKIGFLTAENAVLHAKQTPREQSEPTNGTFAFDGELISGSLPLRELEKEAARVLKWSSPDSMDLDDNPCNHQEEVACSCPIAQDVQQYGLAGTLHCRFTIDGSMCMNEECPYSHVEARAQRIRPIVLCASRVRRVLPVRKARAKSRDPYCFARWFRMLDVIISTTLTASGPVTILDMSGPHLTIVWDGDKIDKIPVPSSSASNNITLSTDAAIAIVENFLEQRQFALPGLSLRIHFRDPVTESVQFSQSTLVSVCPSSSHLNQGQRRFTLFPTKTPPTIPAPVAPFSVDLHTSNAPIVACGCTPIQSLFSSPRSPGPEQSTVWLYAVKRKTEIKPAGAAAGQPRASASKQSMYLSEPAWQPSVDQTPRGMAALLSSLYLFAHSVAQKGIAAEQKVLAVAYAVLRFPPAIRALAVLLFNKVPRPEEKAALAEALYHGLLDFSSRGPAAITSRATRRFETVRILLAYIASAADAESAAAAQRPVEEISVICAVSRKRLRDPVFLDSAVVERGVAILHQRGGALYRPNYSALSPSVSKLSDTDPIAALLPCLPGLSGNSVLFLRANDIGWPPKAFNSPLDTAARDFISAIRRANQTDLVSQGPLELKSADVVPPRIVVDQDGFLAVFTGRGCGTSRDVNFFRPTFPSRHGGHGGDTEVDVNDVGHALQKVIKMRESEDTWQVDRYDGVLNISRPPDEAIILCLDLSESMSRRSGIQTSALLDPQHSASDAESDADAIAAECVQDLSESEIVDSAKSYLEPLHRECHHPWMSLAEHGGPRGSILLDGLAVLAARRLLQLSFQKEDKVWGAQSRANGAAMKELSCFISAIASDTMKEELRAFLIQLLDGPEIAMIGIEPFSVPRKLIDFRTGELLTDPVHPINAPPGVFVNSTSEPWLEKGSWPLGHSISSTLLGPQLKTAVATWISGADILPLIEDGSGDFITVTLRHGGETTSWRLLGSTTTRTLYSLAHRATSARYSAFELKMTGRNSNNVVEEKTSLTLERTVLSAGGNVELVRCIPHTRQTLDVEVPCTDGGPSLRVVVSEDASALVVMSYVDVWSSGMPGSTITDITLWHDLHDCGDGQRRGEPLAPHDTLLGLDVDDSSNAIILDSEPWVQITGGARRMREKSRHLSRLHLLKELFNVFLNRASSFDTSVSLVLGLVTSSEDQELTPIFENFRQQLDRKEAGGDTAIYEALDSARRMLTQYRPDLKNLKKRIIIVSDGEDTTSTTSPDEVCLALQRAGVVVDSVQVGPTSDPVLHSISVATGGYRFSPNTSLADALSIFDLETMLYSGDRSPRQGEPSVKRVKSASTLWSYEDEDLYPIDQITVDSFPPRAPHPLLKAPVKYAANSVGLTAPGGGGDDRMKRIMREIKAVVADPHPRIDVYFNDSDMSFLKIILEVWWKAPTDVENCPYKGGTFLLTCDLPATYPRDPPEIRFVTFIMHPNVSKQGKVCIAELGRLWSSDITLKELLSLVYGTLLTPDLENPLEIQASLKYYEDDGTYALAVAEATAKHAAKTRAEWKAELDE
ncbi:hypothetical protein K438DRAFT_1989266 [Mycena galopus ATCC 62051]|nr:hypothetical protein K438DRAFT_1989266 [Mycena galopus ATCC 62051]